MPKKEKKIDLHHLTPEESLKYEIAEELGLLDKVLENGWKQLSAKETYRRPGYEAEERASGGSGQAVDVRHPLRRAAAPYGRWMLLRPEWYKGANFRL